VPESSQTFLLSIYKLAVDYYQPKIELRTGVKLGAIDVWDYSQLSPRVIDEYTRSYGRLGSILFRRRIRSRCAELKRLGEERSRKGMACYYKNAIYVSFLSSACHEDWIAQVVVHELAHALWEKIGGPNHEQRVQLQSHDQQRYKSLSEGFATFAQLVWFRDIYPPEVRVDVGRKELNPDSVYAQGFNQVKKLVYKHGDTVLLELPKRWREFSNND